MVGPVQHTLAGTSYMTHVVPPFGEIEIECLTHAVVGVGEEQDAQSAGRVRHGPQSDRRFDVSTRGHGQVCSRVWSIKNRRARVGERRGGSTDEHVRESKGQG